MKRAAILLLILMLAACGKRDAPEEAQYYEGTGTIVSIDAGRVLIDHQEIPGFMDAMTMTFPLADPSLAESLEQGTRVRFRVVLEGASYYIDRIEPIHRP